MAERHEVVCRGCGHVIARYDEDRLPRRHDAGGTKILDMTLTGGLSTYGGRPRVFEEEGSWYVECQQCGEPTPTDPAIWNPLRSRL